jgi:predicted N-acetyltransferase YhbS
MNGNISIRRLIEEDAAAISKLSGELGYEADSATMQTRLAKVLKSDSDLLLGAVDSSGALIGWLQAHAAHVIESGFRVEIVGMVVGAANRRRGVGRALVKQAEAWAMSLGARTVVVRSNVTRVESHAFYPALGYTISKTQKVYRKKLAQ